MALTVDDLAVLRRYFAPEQHEFLNKRCYITEAGINDRLEEVDPSFKFEYLHIGQRDAQIVVTARMTVKDVWRDGVGMAAITPSKSGGEANEAEKSAATDALKRCARQFGIGRYLLTMEGVTDDASLRRWLNGGNVQKSKTGDLSAANNGVATNTHASAENGANGTQSQAGGHAGERAARPTWDNEGIVETIRKWCQVESGVTVSNEDMMKWAKVTSLQLNELRKAYSSPDNMFAFIKLSLRPQQRRMS